MDSETRERQAQAARAFVQHADADDREADAALATVFRAVSATRVTHEHDTGRRAFAARVVEGARRAPLAAGRRALVGKGTQAARVGAVAALAAAAAYGGVALWPSLAIEAFVRSVSLLVTGSIWIVWFLNRSLDAWALMARAGRALGLALTSSEALLALVAIMLVGTLAVTALTRLLASQEESRW